MWSNGLTHNRLRATPDVSHAHGDQPSERGQGKEGGQMHVWRDVGVSLLGVAFGNQAGCFLLAPANKCMCTYPLDSGTPNRHMHAVLSQVTGSSLVVARANSTRQDGGRDVEPGTGLSAHIRRSARARELVQAVVPALALHEGCASRAAAKPTGWPCSVKPAQTRASILFQRRTLVFQALPHLLSFSDTRLSQACARPPSHSFHPSLSSSRLWPAQLHSLPTHTRVHSLTRRNCLHCRPVVICSKHIP